MAGAFQRFSNRLLNPGLITEENVRRNRDLASELLRDSMTPKPIQHPTQGLAQLFNALNSQIMQQRSQRGETALRQQQSDEMAAFLENFDPETAQLVQSAPQSFRPQLAGMVAQEQIEQRFAPPPAKKFGITEVKEGNEIVTYETHDGVPVREIARGPRGVVLLTAVLSCLQAGMMSVEGLAA